MDAHNQIKMVLVAFWVKQDRTGDDKQGHAIIIRVVHY